jgi:hypothetical protein
MRTSLLYTAALVCVIVGPATAQSLRDIVKESEGGRMPSRSEWQQRYAAESETDASPQVEPMPAELQPPPRSVGGNSTCLPPGMPALSDLVSVGQQILVAPIEGSEETVTVSAVGLITRDHLARYRDGNIPPDFIVYYVHGHLAAVDDHPGDPTEPDFVDTGMVSPRGAALAEGAPVCRWVRLQRPVDERGPGTPSSRI